MSRSKDEGIKGQAENSLSHTLPQWDSEFTFQREATEKPGSPTLRASPHLLQISNPVIDFGHLCSSGSQGKNLFHNAMQLGGRCQVPFSESLLSCPRNLRSRSTHKSGTSVWLARALGEGRLNLQGWKVGQLDSDGHKSADSKGLAQADKFITVGGPALGCGKQLPSTGNHSGVWQLSAWDSRKQVAGAALSVIHCWRA